MSYSFATSMSTEPGIQDYEELDDDEDQDKDQDLEGIWLMEHDDDLPRMEDDSSSEYETSDEEEGEKFYLTKEEPRQSIQLNTYWEQYGIGIKDNEANPRAAAWEASKKAVDQNRERILSNKRKNEDMLDSMYGKKWREQTGYSSYNTGQTETPGTRLAESMVEGSTTAVEAVPCEETEKESDDPIMIPKTDAENKGKPEEKKSKGKELTWREMFWTSLNISIHS